jgi:hypothetical protein
VAQPWSAAHNIASGILALAVQLVASAHFNDPLDLHRARIFISNAGFDTDDDIMAAVDGEDEPFRYTGQLVASAAPEFSSLSSTKGGLADSLPLPCVISYSHGMLAHADSGVSCSDMAAEVAAADLSDLSLSAVSAPVRAVHPERPDRLRAAGMLPITAAIQQSPR